MSDTPESPSSSSSSPPPPTSAFERWRRKAALVTGIGVTEEERLADLLIHHTRRCEKTKAYLMEYSPAVTFMLKHLKLVGCEVPRENVLCAPCDKTHAGGFEPQRGAVVLCAGNFFNQAHMETTMVHELMHMYDQCKFKVDWSNLRHHACSEIRANSLSGDCRYTRELRRGEFASFSKQHQACARRTAVISVAANPACPNTEAAERAVNEVWESCFNDTRPFDESALLTRPSLLALAAPLVHAITLTIPQNPRSNEPVTITWTTQAGDPNTFSIELINQQFNNAFAIANNVDVTQQEITLTLPVVPVGGGYTLEAVDIGNINNVFASTGDFNIGPGSSNAPSNSAASTSAAATSPTVTAPVTKSPTLSASGSNAVSTGATNVNTVSGLSSAPSNSASAANSAQSNTSSAAPLSGAAVSSFGANKGVVAAALLSALAGAVVVAL